MMEPELFRRIYESIVNRETTYDGIYYTGVKTTRIVCRPSCRARTPRPENIRLYRSVSDAVRDGFRPCKRCRPDASGPLGPDAALAAEVDALLAAGLEEPWTLQQLAGRLSVSPSHLQRTYKRVTGHSPAEQLGLARLGAAKRMLAEGSTSARDIGLAVGFRSPSHFTAWFRRMTGVTPGEYREQLKQTDEAVRKEE